MPRRQAEPAAIALDTLACVRGGRLLFERLDLTLAPGEMALVEGPNGAGKTSLLRIVAGLLRPAAGRRSVTGRVALADERPALDEDLPLEKALLFWARIDKRGFAECDQAMRALALDRLAEVPVRMLSTGQKRRAGLARATVSDAPVWLLDEPASGLDADGIELLRRVLSHHLEQGGIALAASHQPLGIAPAKRIALGKPA